VEDEDEEVEEVEDLSSGECGGEITGETKGMGGSMSMEVGGEEKGVWKTSSPESSSSESLGLKADVICCWGERANGSGMPSLDNGAPDKPVRFTVTDALPF
jgi:hypothetical protein